MYPESKRVRFTTKQKLLFLMVITVVAVVVGSIALRPKPKHEIAIAGLSAISAPSERKLATNETLYNVLEKNLPNTNKGSIRDAVVRSDSYIDNYDAVKDLHHTSLIVDIPSVKQSYIVYIEWSEDSSNPNLSGYPVTIQCLPKDLLKYGSFDCKPMDLSTSSTTPDILYRYLPYHVESKYTVKDVAAQGDGTTRLSVDAYMPGWMVEMSPELLAQYTTEIQAWIGSKGLDPSKYTIDYNY